MRNCRLDDFSKNGVLVPEDTAELYLERLCIDSEEMKDYLKLKNNYAETKDRISFALVVYKCNGDNCGVEREISALLKHTFFTIYTV